MQEKVAEVCAGSDRVAEVEFPQKLSTINQKFSFVFDFSGSNDDGLSFWEVVAAEVVACCVELVVGCATSSG